MDKWAVYKSVALRPVEATKMLWAHKRTLRYLWSHNKQAFWNYIFVTYFIRGEDCGKGVLDPIWKLTGRAPFLWDLEMEVTTRCYLRCIMCEHTYWPDKSYLNQDLKFETFKKVVDGIPNLKWVNLTGEGSSFLNKDFLDIVRYAKHKGLYVDFSHDFYVFNEEWGKSLIKWGVERIYVSIDAATEETYEKIRVGSDFGRVINNVMNFAWLKEKVGSPLPEICFRFSFFKDNVHEVKKFVELIGNLKSLGDLGDEVPINIVALLEFKETKDWAVEIPKDIVDRVNARAKALGVNIYWSHITHNEEDKPPLDYCVFWSEPYIMITGHVVPCCAVLMSNRRPELEQLSFGNIHNLSLREIWNTDKYRRFRKQVVDSKGAVPKVCLGCRVYNTEARARRYGVK